VVYNGLIYRVAKGVAKAVYVTDVNTPAADGPDPNMSNLTYGRRRAKRGSRRTAEASFPR
jgi:hypothetical protein